MLIEKGNSGVTNSEYVIVLTPINTHFHKGKYILDHCNQLKLGLHGTL